MIKLERLPVMLTVRDVSRILGISKSSAYSMVRMPDFPACRIGPKRILIPRDKFFAWIDRKAKEPLGYYIPKGRASHG